MAHQLEYTYVKARKQWQRCILWMRSVVSDDSSKKKRCHVKKYKLQSAEIKTKTYCYMCLKGSNTDILHLTVRHSAVENLSQHPVVTKIKSSYEDKGQISEKLKFTHRGNKELFKDI